jgi:ABC-type sugar transport system permease subunit
LVGCNFETSFDQEATADLRAAKPLGRFVGLEIFKDRGHLALLEVKEIWGATSSFEEFFSRLTNLPFYRAMYFTLTFTFIVTPLVVLVGFLVALNVNALYQRLRGLVVFLSLLPFVINPLIGSLVLFWMIDSRGILGTSIQWIFSDPNLSLKASTGLMWIALIVYGVWHAAPFAFVIFYAGLQTLPEDQIEAAQIDGASRIQQVWYVVLPHLMPLVAFVALIQLMDNFRVFEPIIGFNASAHATSLSWFIFNDLGGETRQLSSASATSVLTIIGVTILLLPVLRRTWKDFREKK